MLPPHFPFNHKDFFTACVSLWTTQISRDTFSFQEHGWLTACSLFGADKSEQFFCRYQMWLKSVFETSWKINRCLSLALPHSHTHSHHFCWVPGNMETFNFNRSALARPLLVNLLTAAGSQFIDHINQCILNVNNSIVVFQSCLKNNHKKICLSCIKPLPRLSHFPSWSS